MRFNKREKVCWLSNNFLFQQLNVITQHQSLSRPAESLANKKSQDPPLVRPVTLSLSITSSQIIYFAWCPHFPLFFFLVPSSQASLLLIAKIGVHSLAERMTDSFPHMLERKCLGTSLSSGTMLLIRVA